MSSGHPIDAVKQIIEQLIPARDKVTKGLRDLTNCLLEDRWLSSHSIEELMNTLSSALRLQDTCFELLPETAARPETFSEIVHRVEQWEERLRLTRQTEEAKRAIQAFSMLQCRVEEAKADIRSQQTKALQLLEADISDELLIASAAVYECAVSLVLHPEGLGNGTELSKQLTESLGFTTKHAIEQGWLYWSDEPVQQIAVGPETAAELDEPEAATGTDSCLSDVSAESNTAEVPATLTESFETFSSADDDTLSASSFPFAFEPLPFGIVDFSRAEYKLYDKAKDKDSFSANRFEGELKQIGGTTQVPAYLMGYIYKNGIAICGQLDHIAVVLPRLASLSTEMAREALQTVLRKLALKGYLLEHTIHFDDISDTYYSLSEYGAGAFRKETSRKLVLSRFQTKLPMRALNEEYVRLESNHSVVAINRLVLLDRTYWGLPWKLRNQLIHTYTSIVPFPHHEWRHSQSGRRYLLIPMLLDAAQSYEDLERISNTLLRNDEDISVIVVQSAEEGKYWAERLSSLEREVYYLICDGQTFRTGGRMSEDCNHLLFEWENREAEADEDVEPSFSDGDTAEREVAPPVEVEAVESVSSSSSPEIFSPVRIKSTITEAGDDVNLIAASVDQAGSMNPYELERIVTTALSMLMADRRAECMALLHSTRGQFGDVDVLRSKLGFILGDPLRRDEDVFALADSPFSFPFHTGENLEDFLNAAFWLKVFFEPDNPNDYRLNNRWKQISSDRSSRVLEQFPRIKELIGYFATFLDRNNVGIKYCTSTDALDQLNITQSLERCRQRIQELLDTVFPHNLSVSINHPKVKQLVNELYGNSGVLTNMLQNALSMPLQELREICQLFSSNGSGGDFGSFDVQPLDSKLEQYLDRHWAEMKFKSDSDKSTRLTGDLRNRIRNWLRAATEPLLQCCVSRSLADKRQVTMSIPPETVRKTRSHALSLMDAALIELEQAEPDGNEVGRSCLTITIRQFHDVLNDRAAESPRKFYEPLLLSGEIELDQKYLPYFDDEWQQQAPGIAGFRIWERLLRHCELELPSWEDAANRAFWNCDMGIYDLIVRRYGNLHAEAKVEDTRRTAHSRLNKYMDDFLTDVESAQNYGQMNSNDELDEYFRLAEAAKRHAERTENAGLFKRLLEACREQIVKSSNSRATTLRSWLETLKSNILLNPDRDLNENDEDVLQQWPILDKIKQMLDKRNMTVAEDYLQLAENGEKDTPSIQISDRDHYVLFEESYQRLFNVCNEHKRDDLYRTYITSVKSLLFPKQNNRNTESADKFIHTWFKMHNLDEFMEQLLFHKVNKIIKERDQEYYVFPAAHDARTGQYPHPFKVFGTQAVEQGLRILTMAGIRTAENVLEEVARRGAGYGSATIVILDFALSLAERRQLARSIKFRSISETIVVMDRVMALFLAGYGRIDRGKVFLSVALPSSKVQPYISVGSISPEMFIGRTDELDKIQNPSGPVFVYGGRQLGKTALLMEVRNREHDPVNGRYAIFVDLRDQGYDASLAKISKELVENRVLQQPCGTWEQLNSALRDRLANQERPIRKLMLLLDEADVFIESCEAHSYHPLVMLKELKDRFNYEFKFVLAGLRNIVRFSRQRLKGNSVLAHLNHITVRPMKYLDARDLLLRPLQYLGFRLGEDSEDIISLILAKTNYYPGLIHFYCEKLIEAIADSYRNGNYSEAAAPPYMLDEKHIKTLLGQKEFLSQIEDKFQITLQLDTDDQYDILAKAMAYHYHEKGVGQGANVRDMIDICQYFDIHRITDLTEENVRALLEEMVELNILRQEARDKGTYVFNRYSFFQMLGNFDRVFEELGAYSQLEAVSHG